MDQSEEQTQGGEEALPELPLQGQETPLMRRKPGGDLEKNVFSLYSFNRMEIVIMNLRLRKLMLREINDLPPNYTASK